MKKTLFILGLLLSFAFLYAQNSDLVRTKVDNQPTIEMLSISAQAKIVSNLSRAPQGMVNVTLTAGDVWGDGTGYQMLIGPTSLWGTTIPTEGALHGNCNPPATLYDAFTYKIPTNANPVCITNNIVINNSITIQIEAGTYAYCIVNPTPGDRFWIAGGDNGRKASYTFEAGKKYTFTAFLQGQNDRVSILVENDIDCAPATNLVVNYTTDCEAQLTWTASADAISYNVYRDGAVIANVTGTSYTDADFASYIGQVWGVSAVCEEGETAPVSVTKGACNTCRPATNLEVTFINGCDAVELTWAPPAKGRNDLLWDNTDIDLTPAGDGLISSYWSNTNNWVFTADDFDADGPWVIETVYAAGFANSPSVVPTKMAIVIYANEGGRPGAEIYRNNAIPVTPDDITEIILPTPFELPGEGKYWIAIAGAYDNHTPLASYRWNIYTGTRGIGANAHLHDPGNLFGSGTNWLSVPGLLPNMRSMWFAIVGESNLSPRQYNVYRNGTLITTTEETSYIDNADLDPHATYTWQVKVICSSGESTPVSKAKSCLSIKENTKGFSIVPNPATNNITISAGNNFHTIELVNFLGQTVLSQSNTGNTVTLDVSNLTNGVYFARIISDNGATVKKFVKQ